MTGLPTPGPVERARWSPWTDGTHIPGRLHHRIPIPALPFPCTPRQSAALPDGFSRIQAILNSIYVRLDWSSCSSKTLMAVMLEPPSSPSLETSISVEDAPEGLRMLFSPLPTSIISPVASSRHEDKNIGTSIPLQDSQTPCQLPPRSPPMMPAPRPDIPTGPGCHRPLALSGHPKNPEHVPLTLPSLRIEHLPTRGNYFHVRPVVGRVNNSIVGVERPRPKAY